MNRYLIAATALALVPTLAVAKNDCKSKQDDPKHHHIAASPETVHWGYFSKTLEPAIFARSGDFVTVETLTHHANDDPSLMVDGDAGAESVFHWEPGDKGVDRRGAGPDDHERGTGGGFGVHILTGPIHVCDAEPGDVIEVRILDMHPRPSGADPTKTYGSNAAAAWGFHYSTLDDPREVITIYEVDATQQQDWAKAIYNYRWVPQTDPDGVVHETIDYPGVPVDHSLITKNENVLEGVRVPIRPHWGTMGLAPLEADFVDSIPPSYFGGNIDNWRVGKGGTMFYPVAVEGGLLSMGDPHAAQGDSELAGTAIETSLTGTVQVILHKAGVMDWVQSPLLETDSEWVVHGFSYANYLDALGETAQQDIYSNSSVDGAMLDAYGKMRDFLMETQGLTEDEAISLMSVAADFGITQVVDGNWGVHGVIQKRVFAGRD